ncbi:LytTR family DNA-binding domain-containing protein [Aquimarina gracilis]|uniref:LytTR family DNA-binding domain-containing protein n=1 Tax=Aquimarina gracilis TaxID=874422 RepID=A0ABU6A084_9FLAO|nr:LytTR family DNA-binding domain-containing protein [Aquimarina gracilis]MEB3347537.1 LytTR family DNA-binding domain-containing protein [Aquimarina gracilis]
MKTRCLLVDDEPLALRLLEKHISKIESFDIVAKCNNAIQALDILKKEPIDLMFLDIKMPNITGFEFLKTLKHPPKTIITTAYRDFAIEGYDLDILDYLLKPITFERFFRAVERFSREKTIHNKNISVLKDEQQLLVKAGNKYHKVILNEILYLESIKDYIKFHLTQKQITAKYKISDIEKELDSDSFLRIHRSYIINLNKITAYTHNDIELGDIEIPIGVSYKEKVYSKLRIKR